jgi:hypothetical protein
MKVGDIHPRRYTRKGAIRPTGSLFNIIMVNSDKVSYKRIPDSKCRFIIDEAKFNTLLWAKTVKQWGGVYEKIANTGKCACCKDITHVAPVRNKITGKVVVLGTDCCQLFDTEIRSFYAAVRYVNDKLIKFINSTEKSKKLNIEDSKLGLIRRKVNYHTSIRLSTNNDTFIYCLQTYYKPKKNDEPDIIMLLKAKLNYNEMIEQYKTLSSETIRYGKNCGKSYINCMCYLKWRLKKLPNYYHYINTDKRIKLFLKLHEIFTAE